MIDQIVYSVPLHIEIIGGDCRAKIVNKHLTRKWYCFRSGLADGNIVDVYITDGRNPESEGFIPSYFHPAQEWIVSIDERISVVLVPCVVFQDRFHAHKA